MRSRLLVPAVLVALLACAAVPAIAAAPKPKLSLATKTQEAALQRGAVVVRVAVTRKARVAVRARGTVKGASDEVRFRLGPKAKRISGTARFPLRLNARKAELIAHAIERCSRVIVRVRAKATRGASTKRAKMRAPLRRHRTC